MASATAKMMKKALKTGSTSPKTRFLGHFGEKSHENRIEQAASGYDPQAVDMRWLPRATNAILTPGGSILTRDVRGMKMKIKWTILAVVVFLMGCSSGVIEYRNGNFNTAFHSDWPTYGLPLVELSTIYKLIEEGNTEKAKEITKTLLELAYQDAQLRMKVIPDEMKPSIEKAMLTARPILENSL